MTDYFIGIDIGTQGARVVLIDRIGEIIWSGEENFPLSDASREEQSPQMWWHVCSRLLKNMVNSVRDQMDINAIRSAAVTSTSGTMIPLDKDHLPLHNALMYSDKRSAVQADKATAIALQEHNSGYSNYNYSSGLAKMVWFVEAFPEKATKISQWIHAADFVTGMLCGKWGVTDYTNALKSGYDVSSYLWPEYLYTKLPLQKSWLPEVVPSGTVIGSLTAEVSKITGLPSSINVSAGITDGCASQVASGAVSKGDWNTTIGTTMVIKGVTEKEIVDKSGRVYSHRHPEGYWMPGGASNTGADWVSSEFTGKLQEMNKAAEELIPTGLIAYPLMQKGERFPMISPEARGFAPPGISEADRFTANMEGVSYLERYAYALIKQLSGEEVTAVYTAGGASNSEVWLKIRASVLNKVIYKMKHVSGAVGAAIVGASDTSFSSLTGAAKALTVIEKEIHPEPELVAAYENYYVKFVEVMKGKGYL